MLEALRPVAMFLMMPLLLLGCSNDDSEDKPPSFSLMASCSSNLTGAGPRVYLNCATASGNLVSVDVMGADINDEVDAYNLIITFSPAAFQYVGFDKTTLFTPGSDCTLDGSLLCLDNASSANSNGQIVLGVSKIGTNPTGVVIGAGPQRLARLIFEAASASQTAPLFSTAAQPGCVGQTTTGTALLEVLESGTCNSTVIGGITFSAQVTLTAVP